MAKETKKVPSKKARKPSNEPLEVLSVRLPSTEIEFLNKLSEETGWPKRLLVVRALSLLRMDKTIQKLREALRELEETQKTAGTF